MFEDGFAASVSTSDLTLLLVTMMLAEVPESGDFDSYVEDWGTNKDINGNGLDGNEMVIAAIANEVISRPDSLLGDMLKNLVGYIL
jgi:hypothetical protein